MIEYTTKTGLAQFKPTLGVDIGEEDFDGGIGWCLACGTTQDGVGPDARRYVCADCGKSKVYGLAELALMNLVDTGAGVELGEDED